MRIFFIFLLGCMTQIGFANPYWNPEKVPKDKQQHLASSLHLKKAINIQGLPILRIQVDWLDKQETYVLSNLVIEPSGTPAFITKSKYKPKWGSYLGILKDKDTGEAVYYDSIGTGKEYRKLARSISLRFPKPTQVMDFELYAENPHTGLMELVLVQSLNPTDFTMPPIGSQDLEIKELAIASKSPSLRVAIYAEGYAVNESQQFWNKATKTIAALKEANFPGFEHMNFYAVFSPSNKKLGQAEDLGLPIPEFDSFLGLYYPYWDAFGRWYHVIYPTNDNKFRQALAVVPYDYPIVLVNSDLYWGVGNYKSHTAIPANNANFTYLLLHEIGHFFGLNEEYEGGGRTELEFAPETQEPWSQNITFLNNPELKWKEFVNQHTKIPTPYGDWHSNPPVYGAYQGGYADSTMTQGASHKPGMRCIMDRAASFCAICSQGIWAVIHYDLGQH